MYDDVTPSQVLSGLNVQISCVTTDKEDMKKCPICNLLLPVSRGGIKQEK